MQTASQNRKPTEAQKSWLAQVFGDELWSELNRKREFQAALDTSVDQARCVALRHLARKELTRRGGGWE